MPKEVRSMIKKNCCCIFFAVSLFTVKRDKCNGSLFEHDSRNIISQCFCVKQNQNRIIKKEFRSHQIKILEIMFVRFAFFSLYLHSSPSHVLNNSLLSLTYFMMSVRECLFSGMTLIHNEKRKVNERMVK